MEMTSAPTTPANVSAINPLGMMNRMELEKNQDPKPRKIIQAMEVDVKNNRNVFTRGWRKSM